MAKTIGRAGKALGGGGASTGARGALQEALSQLGSVQAGPDPNDPPVYMGRKGAQLRENDITPDGAVIQRQRKGRDDKVPRSLALAEFYEWTDAQRRKWGEHLVSVGRIKPEDADDFETLRDEWGRAVDEAARFTVAGKKVTPHDVARLMGASGAASGNEPFTGKKTFTRKRVDLSSPEDAKALVRNVLYDQLGRAPRDEEFQAFMGVLHAAQKANPVMETTTQEYRQGDLINESSQVSGGLSAAGAQEVMTQQAMAQPNYAEYQAAAQYMPLLFQALSAPA